MVFWLKSLSLTNINLKKIIVSVTNDLVTDQRVAKVCNTLHSKGFKVVLVGGLLKNKNKLNRNYKTHRINLVFNKGVLFYVEYTIRLFFYLLVTKKDILLSNDLDTLLANYLVSKVQNKKLVYDSHELFTQVPELINRPAKQKIWLKLEQYILPKLKNTYTVCQSIANYYNELYKTNFKVVRNVPVVNTEVLPKGKGLGWDNPFPLGRLRWEKVILYQGAINMGRGLELMIETIPLVENAVFVLVGEGDILEKLKQEVKAKTLTDKIIFLGRKTPEELKKITPYADLGISIEEDLGLNYRFALPNKLFDYIHANIPVLVSNLPEMKKIVTTYQVGEIIQDRKPKKLAKQIRLLLSKSKNEFEFTSAKANLNWQKEQKTILSVFKTL